MRLIFCLILAGFCVAAAAASARDAGNAEAVRGLIADRCTSCHEVPGLGAGRERASPGGPAFREIARNPDRYPPERLRAFLQKPHWPMTQFILSPRDIDNILAYIAAVR